MEETSPGHGRAVNVPSWKPAQWGPICAPLPVTGLAPLADPAICSMAGPFP